MMEANLALATAHRKLSANTPQGDADALALSDDILQLDPANPHAMFLAGTALYRMKQNGLATIVFNAASQLNPGEASIWNNLGCALREWHPHDAVSVFSKALECDPEHTEASKNLAACLGRIGRRDEAIALNKQLMEARPDDPDVPYNLALDLLHTDDWRAAFAAYEGSEGNAQRTVRNYHADKQTPRWNGTDGQTVVVYGEQGVGDEIFAASAYAELLEAYPDTRFIFECDKRLEALFKRSFPSVEIRGTRGLGELDWPRVDQPDQAIIAFGAFALVKPAPATVKPWLKPNPAMVKMFKDYLRELGSGPNIGLSWSGGAIEWDRAERTIPLDVLGPIVSTPGANIISLEYIDGELPEGVHDIAWATRKGVDLDLTAALIAALDAVVSVPQTVCDIAGAVGTPIYALVHENPPWRFAEASGGAWVWEDCQVFRKKAGASWMPTVTKAARKLREDLGLT